MLVRIVMETLPGKASAVAERLMPVGGLSLRVDSSGSQLDGTWRALDGRALEEVLQALARDPDVVGVYPAW